MKKSNLHKQASTPSTQVITESALAKVRGGFKGLNGEPAPAPQAEAANSSPDW